MQALKLREDVEKLRHPAVSAIGEEAGSEGFHFIPREALLKLLSPNVSRIIDEANGIEFYQKNQDLVECVMQKGRLVFATLIMVGEPELPIVEFIKYNLLDSQLPFTKDDLQPALTDPKLVCSFYDRQWEFIAPTLARDVFHRILQPLSSHPMIRMPYISNTKLDSSGAFGNIYIVSIHPQHQATPLTEDPNGQVVRKEFRSIGRGEDYHRKELHCLSALNELRHPNILGILTSYTYNGKHNLVFPLVRDRNLESLLRNSQPAQFSSDETFLVALCGLASAIKEVHFYASKRLNISLIGCNHDIKPENILVRGTSFVLADFGLARLKDTSSAQDTFYLNAFSDYIAPEVQNGNNSIQMTSFTQLSDIWSFGCILAVIFAFMRKGAKGVKEFREKRRAKVDGGMMHYFHGNARTPTLDWISSHGNDSDQFSGPLIELILAMLNLRPDRWPDARVVFSKQKMIDDGDSIAYKEPC